MGAGAPSEVVPAQRSAQNPLPIQQSLLWRRRFCPWIAAPRHKFLQMVSKFESGGSPAARPRSGSGKSWPDRAGPHPARSGGLARLLLAVGVGLIDAHGRQLGHPAVVWRQVADRIGGLGIAGEQEGLAAAATEILVPPRAAAARLAHPV